MRQAARFKSERHSVAHTGTSHGDLLTNRLHVEIWILDKAKQIAKRVTLVHPAQEEETEGFHKEPPVMNAKKKKPNPIEIDVGRSVMNPKDMTPDQRGDEIGRILMGAMMRIEKTEKTDLASSRSHKKRAGNHGKIFAATSSKPRALLSEDMLADRWLCSASRLQRWRSENTGLPYIKIGGKVLYRIEDIVAYENSCQVKPGIQE